MSGSFLLKYTKKSLRKYGKLKLVFAQQNFAYPSFRHLQHSKTNKKITIAISKDRWQKLYVNSKPISIGLSRPSTK